MAKGPQVETLQPADTGLGLWPAGPALPASDGPSPSRPDPVNPSTTAASGLLGLPPEGRYEIVGELARGGIGRVLEANDRELGRSVALKELLRDTPGNRARFHREILFTARLQHPSIVPLYDAIRGPNGTLRYAMKLVTGRTLEDATNASPTINERLALVPHVLAVAAAVAYAHARGVVHRDIKPANILIGAFGETVLVDWGIA